MLTSATRENPVYFDYPYSELDDVQIALPAGVTVESLPKPAKEMMQQTAIYYSVNSGMKGNAAVRRPYLRYRRVLLPGKRLPELKDFFGKVKAGDQEQTGAQNDGGASGN